SAHHNTYSENNISHCGGYGIFTWMGTHNDTFSNNIIYNTSTGIALDNSSSNTLSGNTIFNCTEGIWVFGFSIFNNISTNMIYNNTDYGIDLGESSENNDVEWNNILDNNQTGGCQAYDEGIANTFRYNYWDDWISPDEDGDGFVDDPYNIDGGDNQDLFPRATQVPVVTIVSPLAQIYRTRITVILAGNAFLFKYYIAGVDSSNQTWSVSTNRTLGDSTYTLHVFGFDPIDKYTTHESVSFTIDSTPPNIEILSPLSTTYRQKSLSLIYSISDITEIQTTIYVDGVSNTSSIPSGFTSSFPDGSYNITIIAVDQVGNIGVASVFFTVDTKPPNISIDSPTTTIYVTGSIMITLSGDDDVINYWYYIVGVDSVNQTWASAITRSLPNGSYTLHAYGNDSAGNEGHVSVTFIVEIPPTTPTSTAPTTTPPTTTTDGAKPADDLGTLIGLGIIVFGTLAVGFLFLRRRGRGPPDASVPPEVTDTPDKLEE
ncbi:MAG: NosD domain-containing protein, partial [Promethearchaeota archaeon]